MKAYPISWLHPDTDYIASFPPLNNLPTQYRVTVRGAQRWFATLTDKRVRRGSHRRQRVLVAVIKQAPRGDQ